MKVISPTLAAIVKNPSQSDPEIKVEIYDLNGVTLLGELNTKSGSCSTVDGDLAGGADLVVFDPLRLAKQWGIVRILAGYSGELLPIYRGRLVSIQEDIPMAGMTTLNAIEAISDLFERQIVTPFYDASYLGADALHTGGWTRSQIARDIALLGGILTGSVFPSTTIVEQPPFVMETIADAIAKVLMPEFLKARMNENGLLDIFKVRLTGLPDHAFKEGENLSEINPITYKPAPIVTEVFIEGRSGDEVQVANPATGVHKATFDIVALDTNILNNIAIPQTKIGANLTYGICIDEVDGYNPEKFTKSFAFVGTFSVNIDFKAPNTRHMWGIKNVFIRNISSGGNGNANSFYSASIFYADGTSEQLYSVGGGASIGSRTNFTPPGNKPVMGFVINGSSFSAGGRFGGSGSPRDGSANIDLDFTRMTEREMVVAGILKTDFVNQGGATQLPSLMWNHGAKTAGTIITSKDIPATTEFNFGLRTTSTWEFDIVKAEVNIHGQIWGSGRAKVLAFRQIDVPATAIFGKRQLHIENQSIATEAEAQAIAAVLIVTLSTVRGQGAAEFSWIAQGQPHAEPGDLGTLEITDTVLLETFPSFPLIYIQEPRHSWDVDDDGATLYMTEFRGMQANQSAIAVFKNLSVDLVKERADVQSLYLAGLIKVRIISVNDNSVGGVISTILPRTDRNTYDVELLSEPGVIVQRVTNAFPDAYIPADVALLEFQRGNRSIPLLVGRPHATFSADPADSRALGAGPPLPVDPCIFITTASLANGKVGVVYNQPLNSTSGQFGASWGWSLVYGVLPVGLSIQNSGVLQGSRVGALIGTPTIASTQKVGIRTFDDRGNQAVEEFTITVVP